MYCPKCGTKINDNDKFCNNCGNNITNDHDSQYNYNYTYSNITDEDLRKAYIGNNYEQIKNTKFSLPTFFLGIYYMLYRKMWLYAFIWIVISITTSVLSMVYEIEYLSILNIAFTIAMTINFSKLYFKTVDKRIEKIKQANVDKTNQEILVECKRKGGVSVLAVIVSIIIIFVGVVSLIFLFLASEISNGIKTEMKKNITNKDSSELSYTLPKIFDKNKYESDFYKSFNYYGDTDSCYVNISNYKAYSNQSVEEYLKSSVVSNMESKVSDIMSKTINGNEWKYVEVKSNDKIVYYYASIYNNNIYQVNYTIYQDDNKLCSNGYNSFINSLTFQNLNNGNTI